jgi:hypothetical protein
MARFDYAGLRCPLCGRADLWAWKAGSVRCCACRSIMPRDWLVELIGEPKRLSRVKMTLGLANDLVTEK